MQYVRYNSRRNSYKVSPIIATFLVLCRLFSLDRWNYLEFLFLTQKPNL